MLRSRTAFFTVFVLMASLCPAATITVTADGEPIDPDTYTVPFTGANDLVKNGDGTFTLTGNNTYTGSTTINAGTLKLGAENTLRGTSGITVASGATLELGSKNPLGLGTDTPAPITVNGGKITFTAAGNNANLGNVTLNGGSIEVSANGSGWGSILLAGTITATDDATITGTDKIMVREPTNRVPGNSTAFTVSPGKTLTFNAPITFNDTNGGKVKMIIDGGGTFKLTKAVGTYDDGLLRTTIVVDGTTTATDGSHTTFDIGVGNAFKTSEFVSDKNGDRTKSNLILKLTNGGILNLSSGHVNLGDLVLDGGKITALNPDGTANAGSGYGNVLLCGTTKVTKDSEIAATMYIRGYAGDASNKVMRSNGAGEISVDPGVTLTWSGGLRFAGGGNEHGTIVLTGGGTLLVPTGGAQKDGTTENTITISGEKVTVVDPETSVESEVIRRTTLQYGSGADSGAWFGPIILKDYGVLRTNRSSINDYGFTVSASNGTMIENAGTAEIKFAAGVTVSRPEDLTGAADYDLEFNANKADIRIRDGQLKGSGIVLKTGASNLMVDGSHADFSGEVVVREGLLNVKTGNALGTGSLTLDGGTLGNAGAGGDIRFASDVKVASDSTIDATGGSLKFLGDFTGSANLTKSGGSQVHFLGDHSGYSGTITSTASWLGFYYDPDTEETKSASAAARYVVNTGNASGIIIVPKTNTDVFTFGMIETTGTTSEFRSGADATNNGVTDINIQVGGEDMSGTFAGRFLDYTTSKGTTKVNIEKVGIGTWTWANSPGVTLTTGTLTVSEGKFQIGDGGENKNGHIQGFTYSSFDPVPTAVMPIVVGEDGTLAFNRQSGADFGDGTISRVYVNQEVTFNGGTLLQENSSDVIFGQVAGAEMVIETAEGATGQIIFQDSNPAISVAKITVNGGDVVTKTAMTDATAIDVNGGTFSVGNSSQAASLDAVVNLNEGGTLVSGNANSIANSVVFNGGKVAGDINLKLGDVDVTADTSTLVQMSNNARTFITGDVTGSGEVVLDGSGSAGHQLWFQGDSTAFEGTVVSKNGAFVGLYNDKSSSPNAKYVGDGGNFFLASNAPDDSGVFQFGELSGNGVLRTGNDNQKTAVTVQVGGANTDATYSGSIQNYTHGTANDVISVEKVGTGTWTLSGANTYTGPTTVSEGTLNVTGSLKSPVTVNDGGMLDLDGTVNGDVTVKAGGEIQLTGTVTGNALFEAGSKYIIDLTNEEMYQKLVTEKQPADVGDVRGAADLQLIVTEEVMKEMLGDAESIVLDFLTYLTEQVELTLDDSQAFGVWGLDFSRPGIVALNGALSPSPVGGDVPEPATWLLLAIGAGLMCFAGRRAKKQA
ncbi:MAG: autotransporter-associated beta strand repeat-containing protein [Thermoguttaceae bacterium]|nr:autotransporter-associated beta strand repeat-containing protein [Thermoguttaceae bacterium]